MRVLHLCWEYPPRGSGIGKYIHQIAAGLRSIGHETIIVTSRGDGLPDEEMLARGRVYRLYDKNEIGSRDVAERVCVVAREHGVDLIEAVDHLGEASELLAMPDRPPVLINCRYNDVVPPARYAQAWYGWQKMVIDVACWRARHRIRREKYSIENADLLAAPSAWMINALKNQGLHLPDHIAVLPKPLTSISEWTNEEAKRPTLLIVGRIDIGKGIPYLRNMLEQLVPQFPDLVLEYAGGDSYARFIGSMKSWLERALGAYAKHVSFLGQLGARELDQVYRRAWVVILPSRWDTSPTVLLEAMIRAKPIVASPFGGMEEYLGDERWIANPAENLFASVVSRLLHDTCLRSQMGNVFRQRALREYNPEIAASRYIAFVASALGKKN